MQKGTETLPLALPPEVPDYHERQASHCRALASCAPSAALRTRLLQEARAHEEIASELGGSGAASLG